MSRKTRKLIWSAPLVAVLSRRRRLGHLRGGLRTRRSVQADHADQAPGSVTRVER